MRMLKFILSYVLRGLLTLAILICIYSLAALILFLIPVNTGFQNSEKGVEVFIVSNGVHTDMVLPLSNVYFNWKSRLGQAPAENFSTDFRYVAFGWGDKDFFIHTPAWSDLKFITAFNALFWLGAGAMHVTYYRNQPQIGKYVARVCLTPRQYVKLITYIDHSFKTDDEGRYIEIDGCDYKAIPDVFYEAKGTYSLFYTCNSWTNEGLKQSGIKTASWAPFDWSIMYHLKR